MRSMQSLSVLIARQARSLKFKSFQKLISEIDHYFVLIFWLLAFPGLNAAWLQQTADSVDDTVSGSEGSESKSSFLVQSLSDIGSILFYISEHFICLLNSVCQE